jgi:RNA-directed DNA polymerase
LKPIFWTALKSGAAVVYDLDLQSYFDSIPHERLLACVRMRVVDRSVLHLLRLWLTAPIEERLEQNNGRVSRAVSRPREGTPQGGVISPLLANLYLHWFDVLFQRQKGPGRQYGAKLVRYADDAVVLARQAEPGIMHFLEEKLEGWLGLRINREKTRVLDLRTRGESFDFLGFTFRWGGDKFYGTDRQYLNVFPSQAALKRERRKVHEMTSVHRRWLSVPQTIFYLNRHLRGWANYFAFGYPSPAFRAMDWYVRQRMRQHLRRRSQRPYSLPAGLSVDEFLHHQGLVSLRSLSPSWQPAHAIGDRFRRAGCGKSARPVR